MYTKEIEIIESELSNIVESQIEQYKSFGYEREGEIFSNNGRFCQTMKKGSANSHECSGCDYGIKPVDISYCVECHAGLGLDWKEKYGKIEVDYGELLRKYSVDKGLDKHVKDCWDLINGVTSFDSDGLSLYEALVHIFSRPGIIDDTATQAFRTGSKELRSTPEPDIDLDCIKSAMEMVKGIVKDKFGDKFHGIDVDDMVDKLTDYFFKTPKEEVEWEPQACPMCEEEYHDARITKTMLELKCDNCDHTWDAGFKFNDQGYLVIDKPLCVMNLNVDYNDFKGLNIDTGTLYIKGDYVGRNAGYVDIKNNDMVKPENWSLSNGDDLKPQEFVGTGNINVQEFKIGGTCIGKTHNIMLPNGNYAIDKKDFKEIYPDSNKSFKRIELKTDTGVHVEGLPAPKEKIK